jgi:MFS family permease
LGVPIAGIGVVAMVVQWANVLGSTQSARIGGQFGERSVLYSAPMVSVIALILLALFQVLPALLLVAVLGFLTAVLRPIVLRVIQKQVTDDVRATVLSMQSLTLTGLLVFTEPALGFIADQSGLPVAYLVMAGASSLFIVFLFWKGRAHFPQPAMKT